MYIANPDERIFYTFLLEQEVLRPTDVSSWDTPEDVVLMDVLGDNANRIDERMYIAAGLRSNSSFVHIPNLRPSWDFIGGIPNHHVWDLIDNFHIFPIREVGPFTWMGVSFFSPFKGEEVLEMLGWGNTRHIVWNVLSPKDYRKLKSEFNEHVPKFL
jgi:hypothetical protein